MEMKGEGNLEIEGDNQTKNTEGEMLKYMGGEREREREREERERERL